MDTNYRRDRYDDFWPELEFDIHNPPHAWVEGVMGAAASPGDPVFYLHHCWIDMLWARWQDAHPGAPFVSSGAGADLNDPLMEWPDRTPADVLDYVALGYNYMLRPPTTAGNPMGYVGVGGARVVYRSGNRRINELSLAPNHPWYYFDMNVIAGGAQLAARDPMGYVGVGAARVVYRGVDDHVHELYLTDQWYHYDMTP